ncbi:MAG: DNA processing protein, partial [Gammaproteobacteria bacterium]
QLAQAGLSITSGLAQGIDGAAHQGALNEIGKTIAVVATGLDQVYPRNHVNLAQEIAHHGAIVSEFVPGTPPKREHFPKRNRIISGLSLGVLVVEAGVRSGSLITARLAGEQGREVYAIPGSIHSPTSRGCHQLIRQGAKLVETTKDILEELKSSTDLFSMMPTKHELKPTNNPINLNWDSQAVLNLLDFEPIGLDELCRRCELRIDSLSAILLELELMGLVAAVAGGQYQRLP